MTGKAVHIVAFDIPYPVDHGGFVDLYYKLLALHQQKIEIYLHCFEYGRLPQSILTQYCTKVYYYKRKTGIKGVSLRLPYIVSSRRNKQLIQRLSADTHPILLEGTHCTYLLYKNYFPNRTILYRLHNIESIYYKKLYQSEKNVFKRFYYLLESWQLRKYEPKVAAAATAILTVSQNDVEPVQHFAPKINVTYLPVFIKPQLVKSKAGIGTYCLYHGNLSVAENEKAAIWLMQKVFRQLPYPLVIAGRNPSLLLIRTANGFEHVHIVSNPDDDNLQTLISDAHINIAISFNETGIKLKLLNALLNGRFCLVNISSALNTGLETACVIANEAFQFQETIKQLFQQSFRFEDVALRQKLLHSKFDNEQTAKQLIAHLYSHYQ